MVWAFIWKLGSGSGSASNKNQNPDPDLDPHQGDESNPDPHQKWCGSTTLVLDPYLFIWFGRLDSDLRSCFVELEALARLKEPVLRIRDPVFLTPKSGIRNSFFRIPDPQPIFLRAWWQNPKLRKKVRQQIFPPSSFVVIVGSGIRDVRSGMDKYPEWNCIGIHKWKYRNSFCFFKF
jgi:hypothetical protein